MKKTVLICLALCGMLATQAQISKGSIFVGGQISGNGSQYSGPSSLQKSSGVSFMPAIGVAIKNNLIIGADLMYTYSRSEYTNSPAQTSNIFGLGGFVRGYTPISKRFLFFWQGRAGYSFSNSTWNNNNISKVNSRSGDLSFMPGISFALTRILYLEAGLSDLAAFRYSKSVYKDNNGNLYNQASNWSFSTSVSGSSVSFGLRLIFPPKK